MGDSADKGTSLVLFACLLWPTVTIDQGTSIWIELIICIMILIVDYCASRKGNTLMIQILVLYCRRLVRSGVNEVYIYAVSVNCFQVTNQRGYIFFQTRV